MTTCGIVWIVPVLPLEMVALVACYVVGTEVQGKGFMEKMYLEIDLELIAR